jgi:hypothetical protein
MLKHHDYFPSSGFRVLVLLLLKVLEYLIYDY